MHEDKSIDEKRRSLLKKAYVAPTVIALGTLVTPNTGNASSSLSTKHKDNGWGNGDDPAPGNSKHHNRAENNGVNWIQKIFGQGHQD